MSDALRDFLLGRSVNVLDAYPEEHPAKYGVEPAALRKLAAEHLGRIPVGHGDVVFVPGDRRPWRSETGLCGSCEHRRTSDPTGSPRAQCAPGERSVWCCYCWRLRSDVTPDGGTA